jgi:hypothetical protein
MSNLKEKINSGGGKLQGAELNSHPPQLTWFFTSIYPNLNHNMYTFKETFISWASLDELTNEKMRLESIRNSLVMRNSGLLA